MTSAGGSDSSVYFSFRWSPPGHTVSIHNLWTNALMPAYSTDRLRVSFVDGGDFADYPEELRSEGGLVFWLCTSMVSAELRKDSPLKVMPPTTILQDRPVTEATESLHMWLGDYVGRMIFPRPKHTVGAWIAVSKCIKFVQAANPGHAVEPPCETCGGE